MTAATDSPFWRLGLVGRDIAHSLSPRLHSHALHDAGLHGRYDLLPCPDESALVSAVQRLREGEFAGLNVTTPWKTLARDLCDDLRPVRMCRRPHPPAAVNTLLRQGNRVIGASTDGPGLVDTLLLAGVPLVGARVGLLGAGGAALAVAPDLLEAGAQHVVVTSRRPQQAVALHDLLVTGFGQQACSTAPWGEGQPLANCTLLIHATTLGHATVAPVPDDVFAWIPWTSLRRAVIVDLVYGASPTWWQQAALAGGVPADQRLREVPVASPHLHPQRRAPHGVLLASGEAMLAAQAARSFFLWTGKLPDPLTLLRAISG